MRSHLRAYPWLVEQRVRDGTREAYCINYCLTTRERCGSDVVWLAAPPPWRAQVTYNIKRSADKKYMQQGMINNKTANGMKHYKNQSLTF